MKLVYWYAPCLRDSDCYSIVAKLKKDACRMREEQGAENFGPVEKRVIDYVDAFDLFEMVSAEGGGRGVGS